MAADKPTHTAKYPQVPSQFPLPLSERIIPLVDKHLNKYVMVELSCDHGHTRVALPRLPGKRIRCPICEHLRAVAFLGAGKTVRPLPFHEAVQGFRWNRGTL